MHGLLVGVEVDRAVAALVAQAGGFDAAERGAQVADVVAVEPHHAGLDVLGEVVRPGQVLRPDVGGQAVLGVVRQGEGFVVVLERGDGHDGTEDFLLEDPRVRCDVGKHGGCDVVAFGQVVGPAAAGQEPAFGLADLHVGGHLVVVLGVDERTHLGLGIVGIADNDVFGPGGVLFAEFVVDGAFHQDAGAGGAAFAVEREHAEQAESIAASRSASANTTHGDLPPSSMDRPLRFSAALRKIVWPVVVSPVKEISGTSGCFTNASPASSPRPLTRLNTPSGRPASLKICAHKDAESGVNSAGFRTTVLPVAKAGASFHDSSMNGVFHGVIRPATPIGLRLT